MSEFLAARVHPWQAYRIRRWAEHTGQPLGLVLAEAIRVFLDTQNVQPKLTRQWLQDYRERELEVNPCADG